MVGLSCSDLGVQFDRWVHIADGCNVLEIHLNLVTCCLLAQSCSLFWLDVGSFVFFAAAEVRINHVLELITVLHWVFGPLSVHLRCFDPASQVVLLALKSLPLVQLPAVAHLVTYRGDVDKRHTVSTDVFVQSILTIWIASGWIHVAMVIGPCQAFFSLHYQWLLVRAKHRFICYFGLLGFAMMHVSCLERQWGVEGCILANETLSSVVTGLGLASLDWPMHNLLLWQLRIVVQKAHATGVWVFILVSEFVLLNELCTLDSKVLMVQDTLLGILVHVLRMAMVA